MTLKRAAWLYAIGTALHTIDHFRRGPGSVSWEVVEVGTVGTILAAVVMTLIFTGHRLAPAASVAIGFPHGLGIAAVHWLPRWSVLSDSFFDTSAGLMSWAAVTLEVGGAIAVGVAGLLALRTSRAGSPGSRSPQPIGAAQG
ncbi:MAG: hypothetical protein WD826_06560 [Actinomycetota bacterium]